MNLQLKWHAGALTCVLAVAQAAPAHVPPEILSCAAELDAARRLDCYDRQVAALSTQSAPATVTGSGSRAPPAPPAINPAAARTAGASNSAAPSEFGRDSLSTGAAERSAPKRLSARIEILSSRPEGHLTVSLDNGQVWTQSEDGPDLKLKAGDTVTISKGLLGSYWLSNGPRLAIKVRRTH